MMIRTFMHYIAMLCSFIAISHATSKQDINFERGDPYLYEVRLKNYDVHSGNIYLLGSNHICPTEYLHTITNYIVNHADILVGEIGDKKGTVLFDFDDVSAEEMKKLGLIFEKPLDWLQYLDSEEQLFLEGNFKSIVHNRWGVSLDQVHPSVFNNTLQSLYQITTYDYEGGMDHSITKAFIKNNKPVYALEDGLVRIKSDDELSKISEKDSFQEIFSVKWRIKSLKDAKKIEQKKNIPDLKEYLDGSFDYLTSSIEDQSVQNRNITWIPVMKKILDKNKGKNIVFCFGCGHLLGKTGVLNLLEKEGYELIRFSKRGHGDTTLKSFCNYTEGYTYFDLMLEGLKEAILKQPIPKNPTYAETYKKQIQDDYDFAVKMMIEFSNPNKANSYLSSSGYHRFYQLLLRVKNEFKQQPHHKMLQLEEGKLYYDSVLFHTDLDRAFALAKEHAYKAKENSYLKRYKSFSLE